MSAATQQASMANTNGRMSMLQQQRNEACDRMVLMAGQIQDLTEQLQGATAELQAAKSELDALKASNAANKSDAPMTVKPG